MKKKEFDREYLGVTITSGNYREILEKEGRAGVNFHGKHLAAYLKGKDMFTHGFTQSENGVRYPTRYKVKQKLTQLIENQVLVE